jgi:hypothetical protein
VEDATLLLWVERGKIVAGLFVAIGVVGEFLGDFIASPIIKRRDAAQQAEIARLNKEAGDARKAAGDAMERAASLEQQAEQERLARVKIEERLALRRIGAKEHDALVSALRPYAGASVGVFKLRDIEAEPFAMDIIRVLTDSGWQLDVRGLGGTLPPIIGLQITVNDALPAGKALAAAFKSLPSAHIESKSDLPMAAYISVGLKPPP